ncbi:U3 small nucleolar ribonucleoprotein protein MPP10 isoform X2 [Narcine bancroftii]|uniref:U3 small nucleolar ribonucleoprotein protein MPP10 isoform X2 n=1 Tax=Narcine bancroftii TaxID=1343680 RepID=UPI0038315EB3
MAALESCVRRLWCAVERPELLLSVQDKLASEFIRVTKELYDFQKRQEADGAAGSPLLELVVEKFDEEQIWQEIELQNHSVLNYFKESVAFLVHDNLSRLTRTEGAEVSSPEEFEIEEDYEQAESSGEETGLKKQKFNEKNDQTERLSDEDSDINFDIDKLAKKIKMQKKNPKLPSSELDDDFFKLSEMEAILEEAEKEEENVEDDDEDGIDYFEDIPSEDEEIIKTKTKRKTKSSRNLQYKDFFDPVECEEPAKEELKLKDKNDIDQEQMKCDREVKESYKKVSFDLSSDGEEDDLVVSVKERKKPREEKSNFEKRQEKLRAQIQQMEQSALAQKPWQLLGEVTAQKRPANSLLEEDLLFDHAVRKAPVITEETTLQLEDIIVQRIKDQAWDDVLRKEKTKEETFEYKKRLTLDHEKSKQSLAEIYEQEYLKQTEQESKEEENQQDIEIRKMMNSLFLKLDALSNFHFTPKPPVPEIKVVSNVPSINMEEVAPVNVSNATLLAPEEIKDEGKDKGLRSSKAFFSHLQDQVKAEVRGVKVGDEKNKNKKLSANKLKL